MFSLGWHFEGFLVVDCADCTLGHSLNLSQKNLEKRGPFSSQCLGTLFFSVMFIFELAGLFYCWDTRLYRSRSFIEERLWDGMWLVSGLHNGNWLVIWISHGIWNCSDVFPLHSIWNDFILFLIGFEMYLITYTWVIFRFL